LKNLYTIYGIRFKKNKMEMFEKVYTITDYYDGPRQGVTFFQGKPHLYESRFSDIGGKTKDSFFLMPITSDVFELALEEWDIWLRWEKAFRQGLTSMDNYPALAEDTARHLWLKQELKSRLVLDKSITFCATALFQVFEEQEEKILMVEWTIVSCTDYIDNRNLVDFS
jgi:hypothetical protein